MVTQYLPDPCIPEHPYVPLRTQLGYSSTAFSGGAVTNNNDAHYVPVIFPCDAVLYSIMFCATNATGNYDLGFYNEDLTRIASTGSTAMSAGIKTLSLPDYRVLAGETYYGALALSSTSGTIIRVIHNIGAMKAVRWGVEASALPLPATGTPVTTTATTQLPILAFGVR